MKLTDLELIQPKHLTFAFDLCPARSLRQRQQLATQYINAESIFPRTLRGSAFNLRSPAAIDRPWILLPERPVLYPLSIRRRRPDVQFYALLSIS